MVSTQSTTSGDCASAKGPEELPAALQKDVLQSALGQAALSSKERLLIVT